MKHLVLLAVLALVTTGCFAPAPPSPGLRCPPEPTGDFVLDEHNRLLCETVYRF